MSKFIRAFSFFLIAFLQILQFVNNSLSQDIAATIALEPSGGPVATVSGRVLSSGTTRRNLSFLRSRAGIENLADRISDLNLFDKDGKPVGYKKFFAGEYVAAADFYAWSYKINLAPVKDHRAAAHISWVATNNGIFMLDDLLPQFGNKGDRVSAKIVFELPPSWEIASGEKALSDNVLETSDVENTVILGGKSLRRRESRLDRFKISLVTNDEWLFTENEAVETALEIYKQYKSLFGSDASDSAQIIFAKFPVPVAAGVWQAETRGGNVTIVSSDMPFRTQSLQRLHEQLRHEIFHLWLPNGVNLSGNYDWFYEGFALYQSLKTGVLSNQIRFVDFLDTLSRAHNIDAFQPNRVSLIEASKNRWSGSDTSVYARGMLVAFLCDVALLESSKGRKAVGDIFRQIFEKHRFPNQRQDGNAAVLEALRANGELVPLIEKYINGEEKIDWRNELQAAGIENEPDVLRTSLRVKEKLSGRQKALLDKLGYNSWRKLSRKSK